MPRKTGKGSAPANPIANRIVGTGMASVDELRANSRNWRLHPKRQREALSEQLERIGWLQQVIVNKRTGLLVDGHLRVDLARERGELEVPVVYVDLSEEEEALALATLDPIAGMATTDTDQLLALMGSVEVTPAGALEDLLAATANVKPAPEPKEDKEPEPKAPARERRRVDLRIPLTFQKVTARQREELIGQEIPIAIEVAGETMPEAARGIVQEAGEGNGTHLEIHVAIPYALVEGDR